MADLAYIKGRLEGLFELVSLLRETVKEEDAASPKLIERLVEHVYAELGEILDSLGSKPDVQGKVAALKQKIAEAKAKGGSGAVQSYDVLSEILKKGQQQG